VFNIYICLIYIYIYTYKDKKVCNAIHRDWTPMNRNMLSLRGDTLGKSRHIGIVQSKACHASPPGLPIGPIFLRLLPFAYSLILLEHEYLEIDLLFARSLTTCCPFHTSCCLLVMWHLHDVCQIRVKRVLKLASFQVRTTQPWFFPVHLYRQLPGNWLVIPVGNSLRTIVY